ncbi:MAG: SIS domain-containing protein [Sporomusaceae bacterium]|nr:SIS domain-containing protein [Sporomusaceae bacterium]
MSISQIIKDHQAVINQVSEKCLTDIENLANIACETLLNGRTIFFCGNGGSAADSQHLAAEIVVRFQTERRALKAVALSTDTSVLTATGNDYGYEKIFERQVEALVGEGDLLVGLSTSGTSKNIVLAVQKAKSQGARTAVLTGEGGGELAKICDISIKVPSKITARIQEAHILIGHAICAEIDQAEAAQHV